jgi:hypothetical protein
VFLKTEIFVGTDQLSDLKEVERRTIKKTLYEIEGQWRDPKHATLFGDLVNLRIIGREIVQAVEIKQTWK